MGTVVKYDNIFQYNESRGVETLHPLVSVIDFSKAEPIPPGHYRHCFGFYAVFLKDVKCGDCATDVTTTTIRRERSYSWLRGRWSRWR